MHIKSSQVFLVGIVTVLVALEGWRLFRGDPGDASRVVSEERLITIETHLTALAERLDAMENSSKNATSNLLPHNPVDDADTDESERWDKIQDQLHQLQESQEVLTELTARYDRYGLVQALEEEFSTAYDALMDESAPLSSRIKQISKVRRYGKLDDRAMESLMRLWDQQDSSRNRMGLLHALRGVDHPELRDRVITSLADDIQNGYESTKFRWIAVESLEPMREDPLVMEWLQYLSQNDPEEKLQGRVTRLIGDSRSKN